MDARWIGAALLTGLAAGMIAPLSAQQLAPAQPSIMNGDGDEMPPTPPATIPRPRHSRMSAFGHDPELNAEDELAPSQIKQPMPAAVAEPSPDPTAAGAAAHRAGFAEHRKGRWRRAHAKPLVVACHGIFARDSSHRKLAMTFETRNVAYVAVDAANGMHMASVLYEKDPKRRLEVWWSDPTSRSDTHLIVINGVSTWMAPGGLALGLTLAQLEKLNGKPFKLVGFNRDNVAMLSGWNGGELAKPPGGCRLGVSLRADAAVASAARTAFPADRVYGSDNAALRRVNPTVSEILVAY